MTEAMLTVTLKPKSQKLWAGSRVMNFLNPKTPIFTVFNRKIIHRKKTRRFTAFKLTGMTEAMLTVTLKPKSQKLWAGSRDIATSVKLLTDGRTDGRTDGQRLG